MDGIPVIDLSAHREGSGSQRRACQQALRDGLCELGFVRVVRHGVDARLIRRVYAHFERFFAGDERAKAACSGVAGGQRGFTPFGVEHARDHAAPDLKEFFHIGQEADALPAGSDRDAYPGNVWPEEPPALRADGVRLFRALEDCATSILRALALAFQLPADTFSSMTVGGNSILRALHYPPVPSDVPPGAVRAAAHEDINLITLLCEATDAGLEIRLPGARERWSSVDVPPGHIVVDSGDMLSRLTNDVVPSTTHRVVNPKGAAQGHRYSLPFFSHPRPECDLSVLPRFVGPERPARYAPITAAGFLALRLREIGLVP